VAVREIGGWKGLAENRTNTTVLAVVLEDAVAMLGILLTLLVAGVSVVFGPRPVFDAVIAIAVGILLGAMALFLAAANRRLLIDLSDPALDQLVTAFLTTHGVLADVTSVVVDDGHSIAFIHVRPGAGNLPGGFDSQAVGDAVQRHALERERKTIDEVYWKGL
jgi:hypothetical protein